MKQKKSILAVIGALTGVLLLLAVLTWAHPCLSMLTTASGSEVHMACYYYGTVCAALAIVVICSSLAGIAKRNVPVVTLITAGLIVLVVSFGNIGGLHVCAGTMCDGAACSAGNVMSCHNTVLWMRILGAAMMAVGAVSLYNPERQVG